MVPPPTRTIAFRLTVTYAGFEGESTTLEALYTRGLAGEQIAPDLYAQPGMLMFWTHDFTAPWQSEEWREQMRGQLRPNAFLRLVENRWVSGTESFVDIEAWDGEPTFRKTPFDVERAVRELRSTDWEGARAFIDENLLVAVSRDEAIEYFEGRRT